MKLFTRLTLAARLAIGAAAQQPATPMPAPFSHDADVAYAKQLWTALAGDRMAGPDALETTTYEGGTGLQAITLVTLQGKITTAGTTGLGIIKKNFRGVEGKDVGDAEIIATSMEFLVPIR